MEYPFKDLLPLDEVLEREGYYKDWTHLDPEVFYSLTQISEYIKTKGYGVDVRLLIAQLAEHFGLKTTQVVDLANLLQQKFEKLEGVTQSFTNNINSLVAQMEADKNAVIANATVDSEVILARGGKATLGQRLDETTAQLAQNEKLINLKTYPKYGFIDLNKFIGLQHNIDFNLWRDPTDGKIKHDWKLDDSGYQIRYVSRSGSASNDGKTKETAWGRLSQAIQKCESDSAIEKVKIVVYGELDREGAYISETVTKEYIIESETPICTNQYILSYTLEGGLYTAPCPYPIKGVVDIEDIDVRGLPSSLKKVGSVQECSATPKSYYADGSNIYINHENVSRENIRIILSSSLWNFTLSGNSSVILNGITLVSGGGDPVHFKSESGTVGSVILNKIKLLNFGTSSSANGISTNGVKDTKLFECNVYNTMRDGFNYHNTKQVNGKGTVFEYNCYAENVGLEGVTANNNISTAHEGIHIVRVGTKGRNSRGPLIADVNGCYSVNIDVEVYNTGITNMNAYQNSAFCFDDSPATYLPNPNGKAWMINCGGGSPTEWGINGDESFRTGGKIYVDNFNGTNIPDDVVLTHFEQ